MIPCQPSVPGSVPLLPAAGTCSRDPREEDHLLRHPSLQQLQEGKADARSLRDSPMGWMILEHPPLPAQVSAPVNRTVPVPPRKAVQEPKLCLIKNSAVPRCPCLRRPVSDKSDMKAFLLTASRARRAPWWDSAS